MLVGTPDSAWARRGCGGCRNNNSYSCSSGGGYQGGRWGRGGWGMNNGYANSSYSTYNYSSRGYSNNAYSSSQSNCACTNGNGMYTNMSGNGTTYSNAGTAGVMTSQPYTTGYRPEVSYDANGNVISNDVNANNNLNNGVTTGNQNVDRAINNPGIDTRNNGVNTGAPKPPAAPAPATTE